MFSTYSKYSYIIQIIIFLPSGGSLHSLLVLPAPLSICRTHCGPPVKRLSPSVIYSLVYATVTPLTPKTTWQDQFIYKGGTASFKPLTRHSHRAAQVTLQCTLCNDVGGSSGGGGGRNVPLSASPSSSLGTVTGQMK